MDDTGPFDGQHPCCTTALPPAALLLAAMLGVAVLASSPAAAQEGGPAPSPLSLPGEPADDTAPLDTPLVDVQVEGNTTIPTSSIIQHVKCRAGRAVSSQMITADTQALHKTRWFIAVEPRVTHTDQGPILIFRVVERPIVRKVEYRGADQIKEKHLAALTGLKVNSPFDPHTNVEAARRIEAHYHEKGFIFATVGLIKGGDPADREVIFEIVEGKKVRVQDVKFHGNTQWFNSSGYLKTKLQTERMFPVVPGLLALPFGGLYKPDTIPNDIASLKTYYMGLGFFDVQIDHKVNFNEDKSRVTIEYFITEGTRYRVTDIRYEGNSVRSIEELTKDRELNPGEFFNERELNKDLSRMQDLYGSLGRLYASVTPEPQFSETPGETVLVFKINEDKPYIVRDVRIDLRGEHPHTKLSVPLNMSQIRPGDLADPRLIKRTQSRIEGSGLFERGPGGGVRIDIKRVGYEQADDSDDDPIFRGQNDDAEGSAAATGAGYRPDNPFIVQTSAEFSGGNPFAVPDAGEMPAEPATPASEYAPEINRPRRSMPAAPAPGRISAGTLADSGARPQPSLVASQPSTQQVSVEDPFTPPGEVVRNADAVVNPYGQAGQIVPQAGQAGDYTPPWVPASPQGDPFSDYLNGQPPGFVDLNISATEARTGRLMIGAGVNSNSGVVGNIVLSEDNFDILRFPRSFQDVWNGTAFRGDGQRFRIEAVPGNVVSRYLVSWTDPYFLDTDFSLGLSGFYFQRFYTNWDEERAGGRVNLGRQLTQNLSVSGILRAENVEISNPDFPTPQALTDVLGDNMLLTAGGAVTWDNRDSPLMPSEGQIAELTYTHGIEDFQYPRIDLEATQFFTIFSRPDGTGKHILSVGGQAGWTGDETPIFERYFAGGFQSLRGFEFRGVGPREFGMNVGGEFLLAGTVQYMFPLLANDALHGVVFSDFGTVNEDVSIDNFRASVGTGLRITIPAFGPVPLAFDFAFPLAKVDGDETQIFSFYVGMNR